jgi:hypothetical protein
MADAAELKIALTPEDVAGYSPKQLANADAAFEKAGYSAEERARVFGAPGSGTPAPAFVPADGLTDSQAEQMIATGLKHAQTEEVRQAYLREAERRGYKPKDANGQVLKPEGEAPEFSLSFNYNGLDRDTMGRMADTFETYNAGMVNGFNSLQIPQGLASRLQESFAKAAEVHKDTEEPETLANYITNVATTLRGFQNGADLVRYARAGEEYIQAVNPGFHEWLRTNFCFHTLQAQVMLSQLGQAIERRGSKRK